LTVVEDPAVEQLQALAHTALPLLEEEKNHAGLARVWMALGNGVALFQNQFEQMAWAAEKAIYHARLAGQHLPRLVELDIALILGPAHEALDTLDRHAQPASDSYRRRLLRGWLLAMLGRFDEAWSLARSAQLEAKDRIGQIGLAGAGGMVAEIATPGVCDLQHMSSYGLEE
jgi:hypothetical protein